MAPFDWNAPPLPGKPKPEDKAFSNACDEYYKKFGETIGIGYGAFEDMTLPEVTEYILECVRTGKKHVPDKWDGNSDIVL